MKQEKFRNLLRRGMLPMAIAAVLASPIAVAQESQEVTTLDRMQITGSRIRSVDMETQQPVIAVTRADIERQGFTSVSDIVQNISTAGTPAISRADALASGEEVGGQYVDLRNLGPQRTLVLIDGKRMGISSAGYSDLASIPTSVVERIEVLTDGASAIYGSDAIAGVVNIITRKNVEGLEAGAYIGQYSRDGGKKQIYHAVFGSTGERGAFTMGAEYSKEDMVMARDYAFSAASNGPRHPVPDMYNGKVRANGWSATTEKGRLIDSAGKSWTLNPGGDSRNMADYHPTNPLTDYSNPNAQMALQTGMERRSFFANGSYDINDKVKFVADALYTQRETLQQIAGYPYQSGPNGTPLSANSYFNPLGTQADFLRRTWEVPRQTRSELTTFRFSAGLQGSFEVGERIWDWDASYMRNENTGTKTGTGNLLKSHVASAVGPSFRDTDGVVRCGEAGKVIAGCTPWNPMLPYGQAGAGSLTSDAALRAYLFPVSHDTSKTITDVYSANITGTLGSWQAGDIRMAAGLEHRKESASFNPDAMNQAGLTTDLAGASTSGSYSLNEAYLEFDVPLITDKTFAKELAIDVAGRYSDYSTFGNTFNSKFGVRWKPVDDVLIRGTYATGFRAPTVSDLYGGTTDTFDNLTDPCDSSFGAARLNPAVATRCAAAGIPSDFRQEASGGVAATGPGQQTNYTFQSGSNPNLTPEESKSHNLGVVWSPSFVEGLNVSLDYWKIRIDNVITNESVTSILNQCYVLGVGSACGRFTRAPANAKVPLKGYQVTSATRTLSNAGYKETAGYDLAVGYRLPEMSWGKVAVDWKTTYVDYLELKRDNEAQTPVEQENGWADTDGMNSRIRSNMKITWNLREFGASWTMRYYSGAKEFCTYTEECSNPNFVSSYTRAQPVNEIGSNTFHDMQAYVNLPWSARVSLGANNVFNHQGPVMYSKPDSSFTYNGGFDIGRFWYMKYEQKF
ncbi:TonB-dependent receptor plug domain-containing protein [Pseudoxanthomonas indica]|uniref:Iron complex outermembrane recepter protein n=1 Tax=Pseudoxanthomonas indica TaxID=428993 RepID=A0A1T5LND1_9GAMM|nr:TonB-dependent receptor [Pseudoxanthomonas indica]GGD36871.1 TonB-dependent receptor [Pseudoxanthomonas indica]SKC77039.1 iron complex outermembrane recepter protein [Pseudoxanthomonas indica]